MKGRKKETQSERRKDRDTMKGRKKETQSERGKGRDRVKVSV
jgi:hypothetical protein